MIWKFIFENFKSFEKTELDIYQLTTLIGTNASGKSNAVEGIKILSMLVSGLELSVILDGTQNVESQIRGGSQGSKRFRTSAFKLGCRMAFDDGNNDLLYEVKIGVNGRVAIEEEGLYLIKHENPDSRDNKIFKTKPANKDSSDIKVEYRNGKRGKNPDIICSRSAAVISQIVNRVPRDNEADEQYVAYIEKVISVLKRIIVLNPDTVLMRHYSRINDVDLRSNCENISAVLLDICKDTDKKNKVLSFIKRLPENEIEDISFVKTKIGDVIFALKERYLNSTELVDAKKLSDGTLRCIAVIASMLSAKQDSLVVVEEIDNGVHPARVMELLNVICEMAQNNNSDIVITTHNAGMLDRYKKDEIAGVSVVYRDNEKGTSKITSILKIDKLPEMILNGGVGTAMTDQELLKNIKNSDIVKDLSWMGVSI